MVPIMLKKLATKAQSLGNTAERYAQRYLEERGLSLIDSRFLTKGGEIDLIMLDNRTLVFIEVRYRKNDDYGNAEETVTTRKKNKIVFAAKCFLSRNPAWYKYDIRFDVVGITRKSGKIETNWIEHAFEVRN
jgi:putative endonuclease